MIGKIIALRKDIHSADHGLTARIDYVAAKATYMDTPRIPGGIDAAAAQMAATCRRHRRDPRTAHVHMVLSWPAGEDHGTRPPLAHLVTLFEMGDGLAPGGGRHRFFDRRSFSAVLAIELEPMAHQWLDRASLRQAAASACDLWKNCRDNEGFARIILGPTAESAEHSRS